MRKEITVPAAGVSQSFSFTGRSVLIEQAAGYSSFEDVPVISFDVPGGQYPALTRSKYQNPQGKFNKIVITGTAAAAGDSLVLVSVDACVDDFINFDSLGTGRAVAGISFKVTSSDISQELQDLDLVDAAGNMPKKIYVSSVDNDIKYAFNAAPEQGAGGLGTLLRADDPGVEIEGINFIQAFQYINAVNASNGVLTVHKEY